jgi:hypothetical protein
VRSRHLPLTLSLHYSCGSLVPNQSLLKFTPSNPQITETGELILHFRIEEVSRSHQNQLFVVRVSPDVIQFPLNNDINSVDTAPIRVMSKERLSNKSQQISQSSLFTLPLGLSPSPSASPLLVPFSSTTSSSFENQMTFIAPCPGLPLRASPSTADPSPHSSYHPPVPISTQATSTAPSPDITSNLSEWSALTLQELIDVRGRIDTLLARSVSHCLSFSLCLLTPLHSYYSLVLSSQSSAVDPSHSNALPQSQVLVQVPPEEEPMYPNNSEEILFNIYSASDWGAYQPPPPPLTPPSRPPKRKRDSPTKRD